MPSRTRRHRVWPATCRVEDATATIYILKPVYNSKPYAPYLLLQTCDVDGEPTLALTAHPWLASALPGGVRLPYRDQGACGHWVHDPTGGPAPRRPTVSGASSTPTRTSRAGSTRTARSGACATRSCRPTSRGGARSTTGSRAAATSAASPRRASARSSCGRACSGTSSWPETRSQVCHRGLEPRTSR